MTFNPVRRIEVYAENRNYGRRVALTLLGHERRDGLDPTHIVAPVQFVPIEDPGAIYESTVEIDSRDAQQLMDALWSCGIRPTARFASDDALPALRAHLADMQRIAMGQLKHQGLIE